MHNAIEVSGVFNNYGHIHAVRGISFDVQASILFAFLSTNGAGKSTTGDILCTLLAPDADTAVINGHVLGKENFSIRNLNRP